MGANRRIDAGERAPDFVMSGPSGTPARFYAYAGGLPTALVFTPAEESEAPAVGDLVRRLAEREDVAVTQLADPRIAASYGVDADSPQVVVLDPNLRTVGVVPGVDPERVLELLETAVYRGPSTQITDQAPVLFVPGVLDQERRDRLIQLADEDGGVETGVERSTEGSRGDVLDREYKRRRDVTVSDPELLQELSGTIGRRLMPEVQKAFAFKATRFEGFKIACYDAAAGGFFRGHRDNMTPSTAHRVFALTLNLNDSYEGGQLRFPEYGNQLYRPAAGTALVFSCAHLHEVCDVTAGRRFVLLSFLYAESAAGAAR